MWVTEKILFTDNSETLKLFKWSLIPAQSSDAYCSVTAEVITDSTVIREICLPNAFVIDYNERFSDNVGVGEFSLVLRQKLIKY